MAADAREHAHWSTRLREVRRGLSLSLHDVQRVSRSEFKASVVGAYERGERIITVERLMRLAEIYGVAPQSLLPPEPDDVVVIDLTAAEPVAAPPLAVDLDRLTALADRTDANLRFVARFVAYVASLRRDAATGPVRLRSTETEFLGAALGISHIALTDLLGSLGVAFPVA